MLAATNVTECLGICDPYICWPDTPAGQNASRPCPPVKGRLENGHAFKYCTLNGTWEVKVLSNGKEENHTHYEACILPKVLQLIEMCQSFEPSECGTITRITRLIELVGLSLSSVSLIMSLYIFFSYRILKNNRTKIHKNLFFATLFQVIFRLIKYTDQELEEPKQFLSKFYLFEICTVLMEYTRTAMFTWMFIEGLYLHNVITVTVFQEHRFIHMYIWGGWILPAIVTAIWLIVMIVANVKTLWEFYYFLPYYWIMEGPRSALIIINLMFLLNIIRVLVVKLRETQSSEIEQVKKAVRAAIFLLPLMGIPHMPFLMDYRYKNAWKFALWSYSVYFFNTFQGLFVAVLYCFLNGEVQSAIKNNYYLRSSLRRSTYTSCRGFSAGVTPEVDRNSTQVKPRWWICWRQPPQSPEEKEIDICDISLKREDPTTISMVESIPMITRNSNSNGFINGMVKSN